MYYIKFMDLDDAARIMHRFMTYPTLTRPEFSIWKTERAPVTITNYGKGFMSEEEFRQMIASSAFIMIVCVASTDKDDKRRVVLGLMEGDKMISLNFPNSNGKLNDAERKLLRTLQK